MFRTMKIHHFTLKSSKEKIEFRCFSWFGALFLVIRVKKSSYYNHVVCKRLRYWFKKSQKKCVKNLAGLKKGRNFALAKRERHRPPAGDLPGSERTLTRLRQTRSSTRRVVKNKSPSRLEKQARQPWQARPDRASDRSEKLREIYSDI